MTDKGVLARFRELEPFVNLCVGIVHDAKYFEQIVTPK